MEAELWGREYLPEAVNVKPGRRDQVCQAEVAWGEGV